jgi:hypothetical protein
MWVNDPVPYQFNTKMVNRINLMRPIKWSRIFIGLLFLAALGMQSSPVFAASSVLSPNGVASSSLCESSVVQNVTGLESVLPSRFSNQATVSAVCPAAQDAVIREATWMGVEAGLIPNTGLETSSWNGMGTYMPAESSSWNGMGTYMPAAPSSWNGMGTYMPVDSPRVYGGR